MSELFSFDVPTEPGEEAVRVYSPRALSPEARERVAVKLASLYRLLVLDADSRPSVPESVPAPDAEAPEDVP